MVDYRLLEPIEVDELRQADGVFTNDEGEWLGEVSSEYGEVKVMPLTDEGGDYIPAPKGWQGKAQQL